MSPHDTSAKRKQASKKESPEKSSAKIDTNDKPTSKKSNGDTKKNVLSTKADIVMSDEESEEDVIRRPNRR